MDTKTLVVGQDVRMFSGVYSRKGKVVKVTPSGVDVQTGVMQNDGTWNAHELFHFDNSGKVCDPDPIDMYDRGPWELEI
jgi:hypothetical protein